MNDAAPRRDTAAISASSRTGFSRSAIFRCRNGAVMPEATIAYETYGTARAARPQRGADHARLYRQPPRGRAQPGQWRPAGQLGRADRAGQADRHRPAVRRRQQHARLVLRLDQRRQHQPGDRPALRPRFPGDRDRATSSRRRRRCCNSLGVEHLVAVAGPSYGGYQAFQWAVAYPDFMDAIVPVNTAPWASVNTDKQLAEITARLDSRPGLAGRPLSRHRRVPGRDLTQIRIDTLTRYGTAANLARRCIPIRQRPRRRCARWPRTGRATGTRNSLIILRRALLGWDTRPDFARIKAKVLYVLCRSDALFPPKIAPAVIDALQGGRGRGALFRDRQRSRPFVERPRARQMVAGVARVPRTADRPRRVEGRVKDRIETPAPRPSKHRCWSVSGPGDCGCFSSFERRRRSRPARDGAEGFERTGSGGAARTPRAEPAAAAARENARRRFPRTVQEPVRLSAADRRRRSRSASAIRATRPSSAPCCCSMRRSAPTRNGGPRRGRGR